jgi:microcompartment protein CcmK/EutM
VQLGRIAGTVVATRKDENLVGLRLLLVEELGAEFTGTGKFVVAADAVSAGPGEVVLYASGSSARLTAATKDKPVDAVVVAIVDTVDEDGTIRFDKSRGGA